MSSHYKINGVLFDMNGVIIDDERLHELAFAKTLSSKGYILNHKEYKLYFAGRTDKDGLTYFQKEKNILFNINSMALEKSQNYKKSAKAGINSYPGVIELIKSLSSKKILLGIVTSSNRIEALSALEACGVNNYFNVIVTAEEVEKGKPSPEGYLLGAKKLGINPHNCVVIEDAPSGIVAAKSLGMYCVAVTHTHSENELINADLIIPAFNNKTTNLILQILGKKDYQPFNESNNIN